MKRYEKILLIIFSIVFLLQFFDFPGKILLLVLTSWLIAASYLVGGYWIFQTKERKNSILAILAGIVFAVSVYKLPFLVQLRNNPNNIYFPLSNGLLFIVLTVFLLIKRKSDSKYRNTKLIWLRSLIILVVVSFFTYIPTTFKPYRNLIYGLNNGNFSIQENLKMFDFNELFDEAYEEGDCENAIIYAEKAVESGKNWLGVPSDQEAEDYLNSVEINAISGAFTSLYKAYACKANEYYDRDQFDQALNTYLKSEKAISISRPSSEYWKIEHILLKNRIALCYRNIFDYEKADSIFVEVIQEYTSLKDSTDENTAEFYSNLAKSLAEQGGLEYSNSFFEEAIFILKKEDSEDEDINYALIYNYHNLITNLIGLEQLDKAKFYIDETFQILDETDYAFCTTSYYDGYYYYRLSEYKKADEVLSKSLALLESFNEPKNNGIAENLFIKSKVKIALAEYDEARTHLQRAMQIVAKSQGENHSRYANFLFLDAELDQLLGQYQSAESKYHRIINSNNEYDIELAEVYSSLANLELILAKFNKAKSHSEISISSLNDLIGEEDPSITGVINNGAYVNYYIGNYALADSFYRKTININADFELQSTASTAIALNGLGLVMAARKDYKNADSLFVQSLELHKQLFTENHPLTAIVYLNYSGLSISQKQLKKANEMLDKSMRINRNFFDEKHDVFADIFSSYGDLAIAEKQIDLAKEYYRKAHKIYLEKFGENHIKVKSLSKKL
ncbi:tetratricopeptide repeat protein [Brumimicrobium mesophilum]|uniref:tetratricopeptide repeat protein n=1 Tax=Brumimicrobium mesophilum TaxID=392717 RepID=UPI000D14085B|nr:tetratricopeptide repeat protein [Brumimicrobium mesophilum]